MYSVSKDHRRVTCSEVKSPVRTLSTLANTLGTERIDVLKMDIEGAEYTVLPAVIASPIRIAQILVEFHHRAGIESLDATIKWVRQLREAGFQLFHVSETSSEFSFLHRSF